MELLHPAQCISLKSNGWPAFQDVPLHCQQFIFLLWLSSEIFNGSKSECMGKQSQSPKYTRKEEILERQRKTRLCRSVPAQCITCTFESRRRCGRFAGLISGGSRLSCPTCCRCKWPCALSDQGTHVRAIKSSITNRVNVGTQNIYSTWIMFNDSTSSRLTVSTAPATTSTSK